MGIYRGPGGTGDAVNDASSEALITIQARDDALAAQAAAEAAQVAAQLAETNAETAETNAETAETNAELAETNAETAATNAANSASAASTSATNAASSASAASTSASNAATSATNASNSASAASTSATNAAASASTATTQATNASNSASAAATSATNAANSATAAQTAQTAAELAETNAELAETNAETAETNAAASASAASTSASNAASSASAASTSASNASSSASAASTSASNAANSATSAANSATAAQTAQAAAEAALDQFDDTYLGAKSSNPTVDNDGNALTTGDQYFNTVANELRIWNGSTWQSASTVGGTVTSLTVTGAFAANGSTTIGDASGDSVTINASTVSTPNGISFNGTSIPASKTLVVTTDIGSTVQAYDVDTAKLDVAQSWSAAQSFNAGVTLGDASGDALTINSSAVSIPNGLNFDSNTLVIDAANNRVGVGTASPAYQLDVSSNAGSIQRARFVNISASSAAAVMFQLENDAANSLQILQYSSTYTNANEAIIQQNTGGQLNIRTLGAFPILFGTNNTERMRITSTGNVGIGTSSPVGLLDVVSSGNGVIRARSSTGSGTVGFQAQNSDTGTTITDGCFFGIDGSEQAYVYNYENTPILFGTNNTERMRITSGGDVLVGKTAVDFATAGVALQPAGVIGITRSGGAPLIINRLTNDGDLVVFQQDGTPEGSISVSGTTVSYNGGHLSRWSQLPSNQKDDTLLKGTVMSNLDDMCVWVKDGETLPNEQLNKMKVSDVEGDTNVAGVFVNWTFDEQCQSDDMNVAMTGDMIIRIAEGVVVQKGDLLMSAGDGTAKPQGDDIVRSKTIAKVTSNHVTCTYADGSYCVPCVLMAC